MYRGVKEVRLCSSSVTRAGILRSFNIPFIVSKQEFDEDSIKISDPYKYVYQIALGKLKSARSLYGVSIPLICADTIVCARGEILGKASSKEEARRFLALQSGNKVEIISATMFLSEKIRFEDLSVTTYFFDTFSQEDIESYLDSGEWSGKAGACMVEGFCKKYIKNAVGLESTAMGLSIERILPFLE